MTQELLQWKLKETKPAKRSEDVQGIITYFKSEIAE